MNEPIFITDCKTKITLLVRFRFSNIVWTNLFSRNFVDL